MNHEFQISFKDLAIAEVHLDYLARETQSAVDTAVQSVGKMKIEIDSIKQPTIIVLGKVDEFSNGIKKEFGRIKEALEAKKQELLKTEQDFSDYDAAMVEAKSLIEQDLAVASKQYKKAANPLA